MKRFIAILLSLFCVLPVILAVLFLSNNETSDAIMVDGVVYYSTGREMPVEFDESAIQEVISYTDGIPTENGQINFDPKLETRYAKFGEDIAVLINHEWVHFKAK